MNAARRAVEAADASFELGDYPRAYLNGIDALREYLSGRAIEHQATELGVSIPLAPSGLARCVEIQWFAEAAQVRFVAQVAAELAPERRTEADAVVQGLNSEIGHPIWRSAPDLAAIQVAHLDHFDLLPTRIVEIAIKLLRTVCTLHEPAIRPLLGG